MNKSNNKKLKVLWFCSFTNAEIQNILKPIKKCKEKAPWISNLIKVFEDDPQVELHIVSDHEWIPYNKHFTHRGVNYHFYRKGMPLIGRHWPGFFRFDVWTDYYNYKSNFSRIVNKVKPNVIHLHGAENEFCTAIIQFHNKYPIFISIQGFIHKTTSKTKISQKRIKNELEIIRTFNHYGYRTQTMGEDIKGLNQNAVLHWHMYPNKIIKPIKVKKNYDLVFFARLSKDKGIEDLLKAVSLIKKIKPDISLCAIGGGNTKRLHELSIELGVKKNVFWAGFLPTQKDVHKLASTARISVLPTYHDIISGTIVESLFLKLPVVAYNTGSIHEVNKFEEIISLVSIRDVDGLAKAIMDLLSDENLQMQRAEVGYLRAKEMFNTSNEEIRSDLLKAYQEVIEDFHHNQQHLNKSESFY
jgi:glycosyltransferase involved in cell wall biosynthesis